MNLSFYNLWLTFEPYTKQLCWSEALWTPSKAQETERDHFRLEAPKLLEGITVGRISVLVFLGNVWNLERDFVSLFVLDLGREQTVIVGAWKGEGPLLSGDSGFSYIPGSPWEMRSWKRRGWRNGKPRERRSARDNC